MKFTDLIEKRNELVTKLTEVINEPKKEERKLSTTEDSEVLKLQTELDALDVEIEQKRNINNIDTNKTNKQMDKFNDLIVRSGDRIENMHVRALTLANTIDNVTVAGDISSVGYEPFYKQMGVQILPNLTTSIKLPFVNGIIAGKAAQGARVDNGTTLATVDLKPARFTLTETIGKELLAVGNEQALQAYLFEMVKGVDKAITKEIFDVLIAGATATATLVNYTNANMDTLTATVDGDVTILFPRAEFYKAKAVKVDTGSGIFLASKTSSFAGNMWDGTPIFYSALFAPTAANTIVAADLKHVTVGEFNGDYEILYDYTSKAPEGQVIITVVKEAGVVLRNTLACKKSLVS